MRPSPGRHVVSLYLSCRVSERRMLLDDVAFANRVAGVVEQVVEQYAQGLTPEQQGAITSVHA